MSSRRGFVALVVSRIVTVFAVRIVTVFALRIVTVFAVLIACVASAGVAGASDVGAPLWSAPYEVTVDGRWQPLVDRERVGHSSVFDARRDEMIVFGGLRPVASEGLRGHFESEPLGDVQVYSPTGSPAWRTLDLQGPAPEARLEHSAILDITHDRMVVFGGRGAGDLCLDDVWALSLTEPRHWTRLVTAGPGPSPRAGHAAVYDARRGRMLVFGGVDGSQHFAEVWAFDLNGPPAWTRLDAMGDAPAPRSHAAVVLDPVRDQLVILGGYRTPPSFVSPRWVCAPAVWLDPVGTNLMPEPNGFAFFTDAFTLSLAGTPQWRNVFVGGLDPDIEYSAGAVYDPVTDCALLVGHRAWPNMRSTVMWSLRLETMTVSDVECRFYSREPFARLASSMVADLQRRRFLIFGGVSTEGPVPPDVTSLSISQSPTMEWLRVEERVRHLDGLLDSKRSQLLQIPLEIFPVGDTYREFASVDLSGMPRPKRVVVNGTPPEARALPALVADPQRDRMLLFGGHQGTTPLADLWELRLEGAPEWRALEAGEGAPALEYPQAFVSRSRDALIVLGQGAAPWEVWERSLAGSTLWSQYPLSDPGFGGDGGQIVYDEARERLLALPASDTCTGLRALELNGDRVWRYVHVEGYLPRLSWTLDTARDRLIAFGGVEGGGSWHQHSSALRALSLTGDLRVVRLHPAGASPEARLTTSWVVDAPRQRVILFGGLRTNISGVDMWALSFKPESNMPATLSPSRAELLVAAPVPAGPRGTTLRWIASRAGNVRVLVFDAAGRQVRRLVDGMRPAGEDALQWDVRDDGGRALSAGVYFARLETPAGTSTRRIVVVR